MIATRTVFVLISIMAVHTLAANRMNTQPPKQQPDAVAQEQIVDSSIREPSFIDSISVP